MADSTYQVKVYNKQGGDELVVASAGYVTVESGGYIDVQDGGYIKTPVVSEATSANASNFGISVLKATAGTKKKYGLDAPAKGNVKHIQAVVAQATGFICVGASGITIDYNGTAEQYLKMSADMGVTLIADTTASYVVAGRTSTAIATSTSGTS